MKVDGNTKDQKLDVNYAAYKVDTETKTVNRVITITMPDGSKKTVNQVVTFVKEVTRNPFDGSTIKETDWKVDGNASQEEYTAEKIDGYTANINQVAAVTPDVNAEDQKVEISYLENKVETSEKTVNRVIKYILPDGSTKEELQKVTFTYEKIINLWTGEVISEGQRESEKSFAEVTVLEINGKKPSISLVPELTVTPEAEDSVVEVRYEADYKTEIEEKVINRVIYLHHPDGTIEKVNHAVTLTREVKTNLQTGEKQYGDWTRAFFEEFVVPTYDGHVSNIDKIEQSEVTSESKDQEHHVTYHAHQVDAETKTVNRIIKVAMPDGSLKTITQTVTFVKHVTKHPLNGTIISEIEWVVDGNGIWDEFIPEKVDGYTASIDKVAAETPSVDTKDVVVEISYTKDDKPVTPDKPVDPGKPEDPNKPVNPDKPGDSGETEGPGTSEDPGNQNQPEGPAQDNLGNSSTENTSDTGASQGDIQITSLASKGQADKEKGDETKKTTQDNQQLPQTGEKQLQ